MNVLYVHKHHLGCFL